MASASQDLVFRFLGMDAGAGREFDRMAGKAERTAGVSRKALLGIGVAAAAVAAESVKMAAQFQTSVTLLHTQAGASMAEVKRASTGLLELAGPTATSADELAKGLYHIESTGLRGAKALQELKIAAEGARLGGANLEDVTNALNAAMVSGIKGTSDMSKTMGMLNAIVGTGDMRMQDLAEAIAGTGLLTAVKGFGVSLNDVSGALATLGDNGVRGAYAATQIRMAVMALAKPVGTAGPALQALGLTTKSLANDMQHGGLNQALADLHTHLLRAGDSGTKMGQTILDAFGRKAGIGISTLEQEFGRFQNKLHETQQGATGFASSWQGYTKTFGYSFDSAKSAAQSLMIQLGTALLPTATKLMSWIASTAIPALREFAHWLAENSRWTKPLAIGLAALWVATTGPIGAIAVLAAGIVALYRKSETFRDIVQTTGRVIVETWHGLRTAGLAVFRALDAVWRGFANGPLAYVQARFADFADFWRSHSQEIRQVTHAAWSVISSLIRTDVKVILDVVRPALHVLTAAFRVAWDVISGVVTTAWRIIGDVVKMGMRTILDTIGIVLDLITGHWGKAWTDAKKLVADAFNGINSIISDFVHGAADMLYQAGKDIISGLVHGIEDSVGGVKNVLGDLGKKIISWKGPAEYDKVMLRPAGQMIIQGLIDGFRDKTGAVRVTTQSIGRLLAAGLIGGWTGEAGRLKNLLGTDVENALNALTSRVLSILNRQRGILKAAQSRLHQDLSSVRSDTASLAGQLTPDLSGAFTTDAAGNTVLGNVAGFAQGQVAGLQRFAADLAAARKAGLNPTDLMQIANLGADQGDQILRQLLGSGQIGALNTAQAQIARYTRSAASTVEGAAYAGRLAADRRNVHEQTVTLHRIERVLHAIERHAARDVARNVRITVDAKGRMKLTEEDGREIVRELRELARKGITP